MSKLFVYLLIFPLFFMFEQEGFEKMSDVASFRQGIDKMAASTQSIEASFQQEKYLSILSSSVKSAGSMYFKKPGLLKWSYTEPYHYAILLNGDEIKINDEGKINSFEIKNSKIFKELNDLIINSVQGNVLQEERFDISYLENNELYLARLVPKEEHLKEYIKQIDVYFEKSDFTVNKLQLYESGGDYTIISFQNKSLNATLADHIFTFNKQ